MDIFKIFAYAYFCETHIFPSYAYSYAYAYIAWQNLAYIAYLHISICICVPTVSVAFTVDPGKNRVPAGIMLKIVGPARPGQARTILRMFSPARPGPGPAGPGFFAISSTHRGQGCLKGYHCLADLPRKSKFYYFIGKSTSF